MQIEIAKVVVSEGRRPLRDVKELAESMREIGLLNPITLTDDYRLIAGYHRLAAAKHLGWWMIEANIVALEGLKAELAEIDENLIRNELTVLERAEHLKRRKEVYEALYPEATAGQSKARGMNRALGHNVSKIISPTFTADTAKKTGVTRRTIQQDLQIATRLDEAVKAQIRATPLADDKTELLRLARLEPAQQKRGAGEIARGEGTSGVRAKDLEQAER